MGYKIVFPLIIEMRGLKVKFDSYEGLKSFYTKSEGPTLSALTQALEKECINVFNLMHIPSKYTIVEPLKKQS